MHGAEHILEVFYLLLAAQVMAYVFKRLNQPVVIGEVLAGVLVGPALLGLVHEGEVLEFLAELGAIFLLFMVGLETRLRDILAVGKEAFLVAVLGVAFPFLGGYLFGLQIGFETLPALFLGTALVATSVGITARVLQELGVLSRPYARVILGAAVIDDVLGLIVLAVVNGVAKTGQVETGAIAQLVVLSVVFVGLAVLLSTLVARLPLDRLPVGSPLGFALALGVGMAALAASIGLAPIVGAFLGGMLLSEVREKYKLEEPIFAMESFLAPIFFAMVGVRLELSALASPAVLLAGSVVTVMHLGQGPGSAVPGGPHPGGAERPHCGGGHVPPGRGGPDRGRFGPGGRGGQRRGVRHRPLHGGLHDPLRPLCPQAPHRLDGAGG
jgi:Kef-type K+ transport system membrane component KefB